MISADYSKISSHIGDPRNARKKRTHQIHWSNRQPHKSSNIDIE